MDSSTTTYFGVLLEMRRGNGQCKFTLRFQVL